MRARKRERDVQVAVKCPRSVAGYFGFGSAKINSNPCNRHIDMTKMQRSGAQERGMNGSRIATRSSDLLLSGSWTPDRVL